MRLLINKHNIEIAEHCSDEPVEGKLTNTLQFTGKETVATNGFYMVAVSALAPDERPPYCVAVENLLEIKDGLGDTGNWTPPLVEGVRPTVEMHLTVSEPRAEIRLNADYLLKIAEAIKLFGGGTVILSFYGVKSPIKLESTNAHGQKFTGVIAAKNPTAVEIAMDEARRIMGEM
jgi:hypothetical protein